MYVTPLEKSLGAVMLIWLQNHVRTWYGLSCWTWDERSKAVWTWWSWSNFEYAQKKRGEDGVELECSKDVVRTW